MLAEPVPPRTNLVADLPAYALCDWHAHQRWLDAALALAREPGATLDDPRVAWQALATRLEDHDCAALIAAHARAARAGLTRVAYPQTARLPRRQVRLGYLFDATRATSAAASLEPVLRLHSRARFETFAYSLGIDTDTRLAYSIAAAAGTFRPIAHLRPHEAYGLMRCDDIDILVDTCGLASALALQLCLYQPARASVSMLAVACGEHAGIPATSVLAIDPRRRAPAGPAGGGRRARFGLPDTATVLCGFAAPEAIDPDGFAAWMAILAACPTALLWLGDGPAAMRANLRGAAARSGVDPLRLVFCADHPEPGALRHADLFLDTLNTGSAALANALAAGIPTVSIAGARLGARPGAATLEAAGLGDFVAADRAASIGLAVSLCAGDATLVAARARFAAAFVDAGERRLAACVTRIEAGYERICERLSLASANGA